MEPKPRRSRKRSAGTPSKPPDRPTLFLDRDAGGRFVTAALREADYEVVTHDEYFAQNTPDIEWIKAVSRKGWVVITADREIARHEPERSLFATAKAYTFILYALTQVTREERIAAVMNSLPKIFAIAAGGHPYGIYRVHREGHVAYVEVKNPRIPINDP
jgi:hypothetical protein